MIWLMKILESYLEEEVMIKLPDKASKIAKNLKFDEYQRGAASVVYNFYDKKNLWC